jgi:phage terminase small subunit
MPRPRKPAALRQGHRTAAEIEAASGFAPPPGVPECPEWLTSNERTEWFRLAGELSSCGVLGRTDRNVLARYCRVMLWWAAWATPSYPRLDLAAECRRLENELGLTPAARTRVRPIAEPPIRSEEAQAAARLLG